MNLPSQFLQRMEAMLGDEFAAFEKSFHRESIPKKKAGPVSTYPQKFSTDSPVIHCIVPCGNFFRRRRIHRPASPPSVAKTGLEGSCDLLLSTSYQKGFPQHYPHYPQVIHKLSTFCPPVDFLWTTCGLFPKVWGKLVILSTGSGDKFRFPSFPSTH